MTLQKIIYLLLPVLIIGSCQPVKEKQEASLTSHPNILFIFADDMGYGDLSCYNPESQINTANIDKLAAEGMRFMDAHATAALCVQSRYGLLTGQYAFLNERPYQQGIIEPGRPTIAKVLKQAGYHTGMVGKWHQGIVDEKDPPVDTDLAGGPLDHGFDEFFGIPASTDIPPYYFIENKRPVALPSDTIAAREGTAPAPGQRKIQGPFYRAGKIAPNFKHEDVLDRFASEAIDYLKQNANQTEPFFLYLALPAPHTPWLPTEAFRGKSKAGDYGDFALQVDDLVGRVHQTLEELGVEENTLVFFSSDNGPVWYPEDVAQYGHNSVGPLSGMKGDALEGGHRLPFIAKWPGKIEAGSVNNNLIGFTDLIATFRELTQTKIPSTFPHNSHSFLSLLLKQETESKRESIIMRSSSKAYAIRKGKWKLILAKGAAGFSDGYDPSIAAKNPEEAQLYNLEEDISELNNLYAEFPDVVEELKQELDKVLDIK